MADRRGCVEGSDGALAGVCLDFCAGVDGAGGDEVQVLCDRKAEGFILEQTGARPVLPESIWHRTSED